MATRFYHTRDPIENLRVRVVARKVQHGEDHKARGAAVGTTWSHSFHWQEKRSSLQEIQAKKSNKPTLKVPETDREVDATAAEPQHTAESSCVALCSFVDADNYVPDHINERTPTSSQAPPPHLVAGASDYRLSKSVSKSKRPSAASRTASVGTSNSDRVMLRLHREETFRQMHLVLRISEDAMAKTEDIVLATLRYYPHTGLLCATPGFSTCIAEIAAKTHAKGPKLTTYNVSSRSTGARFEYALDNENDLFPMDAPDDLRLLKELQRQDEDEEMRLLDQWRNKHGDHELSTKQVIRHDKTLGTGDDQTMVLLELVSVRGIDSQFPIRIEAELAEPSTPDGSASTTRSGSFRTRTRLSRPVIQENCTCLTAFGHHSQIHLKKGNSAKALPDISPAMHPMLKMAVHSCDSWGRERLLAHCELRLPLTAGFFDVEVPLVRPLLTTQEQLEDFFLGSDRRMVDSALADVTETKTPATGTVVSRLGAQTISAGGCVRIRLNVIESRPQLVRAATVAPLPRLAALSRGNGMAPSGGAVKRSVEEILQAVKTTKRFSDVSQDLATPLAIGGSSSSAVSAILARLQSQSTRGTSPSAG